MKAVKKGERILIYGDADLDGISSTVILKESLQSLGCKNISIFFPNREKDGYGITKRALEQLKGLAPALFVTVDLGISNFEEVKIAKKMGFEIIVVDHHQILSKLPDVSIVVDPQQKGDKYPFKKLANVGITFKLAEALLGKNFSPNLKNSFLELVALATIADMMPQEDENKIFIDHGMASLRNTFRPGLRAFFEIFGENTLENGNLQKIIAALNTSDAVDYYNETYLLLTSSSAEECKKLVQTLMDKCQRKQFRIKEIIAAVEEKIKNKMSDIIVFEGDLSWPLLLAGPVASNICQKYQKPAFIFHRGEEESCGSVRTVNGLNAVEAMSVCSDFLITFGGHPPAAGFRLKNENLERFKRCLTNYFKK